MLQSLPGKCKDTAAGAVLAHKSGHKPAKTNRAKVHLYHFKAPSSPSSRVRHLSQAGTAACMYFHFSP